MGTGRGRGPRGSSAWRSECLRFEGSRGAKHGAYPQQNKKPIVQRILFRCDGGCLCCSRRDEQRRFRMAGTSNFGVQGRSRASSARSWLKQVAGQSRGGRWGVRRQGPGLAKNNTGGVGRHYRPHGHRGQNSERRCRERGAISPTSNVAAEACKAGSGTSSGTSSPKPSGNGGRPPFPAPTVGFGRSGARHASTWAQSCFLGPNKDVQSAASALAQPLKSPHFSLSPAGRSPDAPPIKHPEAKSLAPLWPCARHGLRPRESEE
jgi:hypothetical protein